MKRHGLVAATPRVTETLHAAQPHHAAATLDVIARHYAALPFFADLAALPLAVCIDDPVQAGELDGQLLRVLPRDDAIRVTLHDDGRHAGISVDIDGGVDQLDRILARAPPHHVHRGNAGMRFAEGRA